MALNVSTDLAWFAEMIPCGLADIDVTSLGRELGEAPTMAAVADRLADDLAVGFGLRR